MTVETRRAGLAIVASAEELARLWRSTRAQARPDVWPGLMDGLVEDLFLRTGEALAAGGDPAHVFPSLTGLVRIDPRERDRSRAELDAEWDVVERVLEAACDALGSGEEVRLWLSKAVVVGRAYARRLDRGGGPRGIVVAWLLSGLAAARRPAHAAGLP